MKAAETRRRWFWAGGGAIVVVALVLTLFRGPRESVPVAQKVPSPKVTVRLDPSATVTRETAIFDPRPLFLPTPGVNAAPAPIARREPGSAFRDYLLKPVFAETELTLDSLSLPRGAHVPRSPAVAPGEVLALPSPGILTLGIGRTDVPITPLQSRGALVEILSANSGRSLRTVTLPESVRPPGNGAWQPMEFIAAIDAAGLMGPLMPVERSGVEEVDNFFQNYLARTLRVGEFLQPGFYRVRVGP